MGNRKEIKHDVNRFVCTKEYEMKNVGLTMGILLYLALSCALLAQNKGIVLAPPNDNFSSIEIQEYNGLPRVGLLDGFDVSLERNYTPKTPIELAQQNSIKWNYKKYFGLVELYFFEKFYNKLNSEVLLTNMGSANVRLLKDNDKLYNYLAQDHLLKIAPVLCSDKAFAIYFENLNERGTYLNFSAIWGGRGSDEFRQLDLFRDFSKKHMDNLRSWSLNFWPNDTLEAYLVSPFYISSEYDFSKNGLWFYVNQDDITNILKENTGFNFAFQGFSNNRFPTSIASIKYIEQNDYEYNLGHKRMLIPISQEKAKTLKNINGSYPHFYLVQKIRIELSRIYHSGEGKIDLSYSINSPDMFIYSDVSLKNKIASLKL